MKPSSERRTTRQVRTKNKLATETQRHRDETRRTPPSAAAPCETRPEHKRQNGTACVPVAFRMVRGGRLCRPTGDVLASAVFAPDFLCVSVSLWQIPSVFSV